MVTAQFYQFIGIAGLVANDIGAEAEYYECFQGLGADVVASASSADAPGTPGTPTPEEPVETPPWTEELIEWGLSLLFWQIDAPEGGARGLNDGSRGRGLPAVIDWSVKLVSLKAILVKYAVDQVFDIVAFLNDLVELINGIFDLFGWGLEGELERLIEAVEQLAESGQGDCCEQLLELLDKALLEDDSPILKQIELMLNDLKYNDEEMDLGPVRIWLRSKLIETG